MTKLKDEQIVKLTSSKLATDDSQNIAEDPIKIFDTAKDISKYTKKEQDLLCEKLNLKVRNLFYCVCL